MIRLKALAVAILVAAAPALSQTYGDSFPNSGLISSGGVVEQQVWATSDDTGTLVEWLQQGSDTGYYLYRDGERLKDYTVGSDIAFYNAPTPVKDSTFFYDPVGGRFHLIGIDNTTDWQSGGETQFVHYSSANLSSWTTHSPITAATHLAVSGYTIDHVWAPQIFLEGGLWRFFYTGVEGSTGAKQERIFYCELDAATGDLTDPTAWSGHVFCIDGEVDTAATEAWMTGDTGWGEGSFRDQCRDPSIVYDDVGERWMMVMTVSAVGGGDAVGVAFADELDGPWSLVGYITSTVAAKCESTMYVRSDAMGGKFVAHVTGVSPVGYLADYAYAPWVSTPSNTMNAPEAIKGPFGTYDTNPPSSTARDVYLLVTISFGASGGYTFKTWTLHGAGDWTTLKPTAQLVTYSDVAEVVGPPFEYDDTYAQVGGVESYAVATTADPLNIFGSAMGQRTKSHTISSMSFSWNEPTGTVAIRATLDEDYAEAKYRYKQTVTTDSDASRALASIPWSDWTVDRPATPPRISISNTMTLLDYVHTSLEVVGYWSGNQLDDSAVYSWQYLGFPYAPSNCAAVVDGADVDVTWDAPSPASAYFDTYVILRQVIGTDDTPVVIADTGIVTESYTDVAAPSGTVLYYVRQQLSNGHQSADSNAGFVVVP